MLRLVNATANVTLLVINATLVPLDSITFLPLQMKTVTNVIVMTMGQPVSFAMSPLDNVLAKTTISLVYCVTAVFLDFSTSRIPKNVNAMRMDRSTLLVTMEAESVPAIPTLLEINVPNVPLNILHFPLVMLVCVTLKVLLIILVTTMANVLVIITLLVTNATSVRMEQTIFQPVTSVLPNTGLLDGYLIYPIVKLVTVMRQDPQATIVTQLLDNAPARKTLPETNATNPLPDTTTFLNLKNVLVMAMGLLITIVITLENVFASQTLSEIIVTNVLLDFLDFHLAKQLANVTMMALQFTIVMKMENVLANPM
jgi:hypothetical protein